MEPERSDYLDPRNFKRGPDLPLLASFLAMLLVSVGAVGILAVAWGWVELETPAWPWVVPPPAESVIAASQSTAEPAPEPTPAPPTAAVPTAAPAVVVVQPAEVAEQPKAFVVGNTDGDGVWLRRTPNMADHLVAWPDGTRMVVVGIQTQAEGQVWQHVRDPRGNEGFIPAQWLVPVDD